MMLEAHFWHDYEPFFNRSRPGHYWNWIDFTFLNLAVERTYYVDRFEFHVGLVGFHMNIDLLWGDMEHDRKGPETVEDSSD